MVTASPAGYLADVERLVADVVCSLILARRVGSICKNPGFAQRPAAP